MITLGKPGVENYKWIAFDVFKPIWIALAIYLALTNKVNPWLVLLLATMDTSLKFTYKWRG